VNRLWLAALAFLVTACGFHPTGSNPNGDDAQLVDGPGSGSDASTTILGPCGKVGAVRDDFDDNLTADQWDVATPAQVSETGGELVVTPIGVTGPPGVLPLPIMPAMAQFMGYVSKHTVDLTDDAVTVEVTGMVDASSTAAVAEFGVVNTRTAYALIVVGHGSISFDASGMMSGTTPYDPIAQRWWRVAHSGSTIIAEVSPDGSAWTPIGTPMPKPPWLTRVDIALGGSSTDVNPHGSVHYDNLDLGLAAEGWCKASSLTDQFERQMVGIDWDALATKNAPPTCTPSVNAGAHFDQTGMATGRCELTTTQGFDLTGDSVMIYVPPITDPRTGWNPFIRVVADAVADTFYLQFEHTAIDQLCAQVHNDPEQCIPYDPANDLYWRIRESAGVLTFETGLDTVNWTPVGMTTITFPVTAVDVEIGTMVTAPFAPAVSLGISAYNNNPPL
jgi:hypothetical protein